MTRLASPAAFASLVTPTPLGDALLIASREGLVALELLAGETADGRASSASSAAELDQTPELLAASAILRDAAAQLDEYFAGALRTFTVPLDWRHVHGFAVDALRAAIDIPYGETAAYGEVAIMAGRPRAARAVGTACARSPWSIIVPVHRVVRADGTIGPYGNNPETKRFLIDLERRNHG